MPIVLTDADEQLVSAAKAAIEEACKNAESRSGVARRIAAFSVRQRNRGRDKAIKANPFDGTCAISGAKLDRRDAVLDEIDPLRGYDGPVRWICQVANNSGRRSCGVCAQAAESADDEGT